MPTELQLADDYAAALDGIASRATNNTTLALTRSLNRTLRDLRRFYGQFVDPELATTRSADGVMRRPGAYSIADGNAKFRKLIELAQAYLPEAQLAALQRQYLQDFADAVALGGELGQELAQQADPQSKARGPFVGASKAAVEAAANTASAYIRGEVESFRDSLVRIVSDGVGRGKGAKALEREIKEALYGAKDPDGLTAKMGLKQRAELIARSELANAYVGAQKAAASRNGFIYGRWIATKDERTCPVCASRHGKIYRLDEMVGTLHPRCVLGGTFVSPGPLAASFRAVYRGDVITITLKDGSIFAVTFQHPVLTTRGIVPAYTLRKGDQLVGNNPEIPHKDLGFAGPDLHQVPARAEDVFAAFAQSGAVSSIGMPVTPLDLHGDGDSVKGDVDVVRATGFLQGYWESTVGQDLPKGQGVEARVRFRPFSSFSHADGAIYGLGAAACGSVSRLSEANAILLGGLSHADEHRIATTAWRDPALVQPKTDDRATYAKLVGKCFDAHPTLVQLHEVAMVDAMPFHGYVYTFETFSGFYSMGIQTRVVNQNCRCSVSPVSTDAVEETDPNLRKRLLREDYWERARDEMITEFAAERKWPWVKASKVLKEAIKKPAPSERRQYPGMTRAPEPIA